MHPVIITKSLPPTNHRGARIRARCVLKSIIVPWDYRLGVSANHKAAAARLIAEMGLGDPSKWHGGWLPGGGYAFVRATKWSGVQVKAIARLRTETEAAKKEEEK